VRHGSSTYPPSARSGPRRHGKKNAAGRGRPCLSSSLEGSPDPRASICPHPAACMTGRWDDRGASWVWWWRSWRIILAEPDPDGRPAVLQIPYRCAERTLSQLERRQRCCCLARSPDRRASLPHSCRAHPAAHRGERQHPAWSGGASTLHVGAEWGGCQTSPVHCSGRPGPLRDTQKSSALVSPGASRAGRTRRVTSSWALTGPGELGDEAEIRRSGLADSQMVGSSPSARHSSNTRTYAVRSPASSPRMWRSLSQRSRSNGSPDCATASTSGTSFRATAHTALVLSPPFRASSAS
jgi:hypothetical protein